MINAEQIRAARALLDWSTAQLAEQTVLTVNGINKIERGHVQAQRETMERLEKVFSDNGIEFIGNRGVARRDETIRRISGARALYEFLDDVYATVIGGGEICVTGVDENMFDKYTDKNDTTHSTRMKALGNKISMRCILREGDTNTAHSSYITYRWMAVEQFDASPMYIYNHKLAMIDFTKAEPNIIVIDAPAIAQAFRKQFDFIWQHCEETTASKK